MDNDLKEAASLLKISLPNLEKAYISSQEIITEYKNKIPEYISIDNDVEDQADVILLGSIARGESSTVSDCDYFILQNGASPFVTRELIKATEKIRESAGHREPGTQGVFGQIVIAANLYESIGLDFDTNANMTRRLLLLTESVSVWGKTREKVIKNIFDRYCADYLPLVRTAGSKPHIPRYLLNDLVRFWRTMAVDFGTKRWRTMRDDSYLRLAKLRITRKILFTGPLATILLVPERTKTINDLPEYLNLWMTKQPLAQLASMCTLLSDVCKNALSDLLMAYDDFNGIISQHDVRERLTNPQGDANGFKDVRHKCDEISNTIQHSLETIFFDDNLLRKQIREFGVF